MVRDCNSKQRIKETWEFLVKQSTEVTEYGELWARWPIDKVTVHEERFKIKFKSGQRWMWKDRVEKL